MIKKILEKICQAIKDKKKMGMGWANKKRRDRRLKKRRRSKGKKQSKKG
ncbi:hypothetical protein ES703_122810 [subsurface metagenome]